MDRIWQWAWDRYGAHRYLWVMGVLLCFGGIPAFVFFSSMIVAFEGSNRYAEAAAITVAVLLLQYFLGLLLLARTMRRIEECASGRVSHPMTVLVATYADTRRLTAWQVVTGMISMAGIAACVGATAGATGWRLVQWAILGAAYGVAVGMAFVHSLAEGLWRPARAAISGDAGIGDSLPRSRPTFAAWTIMSILGTAFCFALGGSMIGAVLDRDPMTTVLIACTLTLSYGPLVIAAFTPLFRPLQDLAHGTERVAVGDYSQRLPVVQDDDLGALSASFNRMQAGLAERRRLQAAFGTYVDPVLATKLLAQGDDVFSGERREVTVMFVDIRDFTPFAESNTAEDTVARLNALFEIVVPAVVDAGGHVNKFLGDGALAVFGAPNDLADHADAALNAAMSIHRMVAERFGGELRIGIGVNTGVVIAGTIGGGSKLEFTLIGDTVNVAARVEQLTKTTGDTILVTQQSVEALRTPPQGLVDRGSHGLKGKSAATQVFGVDVKNLLSK
jgi:adenylate cyclase